MGKTLMMRGSYAVLLVLALGACCATADNLGTLASSVEQCVDSHQAVKGVCGSFGQDSAACIESSKAHEDAGCLGESNMPSGLGCDTNNKDVEPKHVCEAAAVVCNVPGRDYCETDVLVKCMKSIGQMCGSSEGKSGSPSEQLKPNQLSVQQSNEKSEKAAEKKPDKRR